MSINIQIPAAGWKPREHQMGIWTDMEAKVPNILAICHRRFGKDELGLQDCATRAAETPANYFYCLPEQEHARRSMWTAINPHTGKRRMDEIFPEGFRIGNLKEQEMAIETHSVGGKSRVQFLGSDNYDAIVGGSPYGVYLSEWAIADPQALAMLRPIVEENGGFIRFLTTPRGKNHVYRQFVAQKGKPGWAVHYLTANDTSVFSPEKLETLRQEAVNLYGPDIGNALFQQEYMCTFETIVPGSYYIDILEKLERKGQMFERLPYVPDQPVYAAFDIGWSDEMAIWYVQVDPTGWVNIVGYDEFRKTSIPQLVKILKEREWSYGALLLPHDGAHHEVTSGETCETILTKNGFLCYIMPRTDEITQIASVRILLPRCNFDKTECERGITCLKAFHNKYKTETDTWSPKPVHDWSSHGAKAFATLAYFADSLKRGVRGGRNADSQQRDFYSTDRVGSSQGGLGWMR